MSKYVCAGVLVLLAAIAAGQAETEPATGTLVVNVSNLQSDEGDLRFVIFDSKKHFLKNPVRAGVVEIAGGRASWVVDDLPHGTYAVLVHHDVDGSGKMERHWYGKPKEPTGVSNDAPSKFGPPKFKHAKFEFETSLLTLEIAVR